MIRVVALALGTAGCSLMGLYDATPVGACPGESVHCPPDGDCIDLTADPQNCGGCGVQCDDREFCEEGVCVCRPELTDCAGVCIDTHTNPQNCGNCERPPCSPGQVCVDRTCVDEPCPDGLTECMPGECIDATSDPLHCGSCDERCSNDQLCLDGLCADYGPAVGCESCDGCDACEGHESCCDVFPYGPVCIDPAQEECPVR